MEISQNFVAFSEYMNFTAIKEKQVVYLNPAISILRPVFLLLYYFILVRYLMIKDKPKIDFHNT